MEIKNQMFYGKDDDDDDDKVLCYTNAGFSMTEYS